MLRIHGASPSSSDQDESQIRKTYSKSKRVTTKSQKRRDKQASSGHVEIIRTPGWIQLQGKHKSVDNILCVVADELTIRNKRYPALSLLVHFDRIFEKSKKDDMAVLTLIQSYIFAYIDLQHFDKPFKHCKQLLDKIDAYGLKDPLIAFARVYMEMFHFYIIKSKPGKAFSVAQRAVLCVQYYAPNEWTAKVWNTMAKMYDLLAHITPRHRRKYQDQAVICLTTARKHLLALNMQDDKILRARLMNTLSIVELKLDIPIVVIVRLETRYQRLKQCTVSLCDVTEAQNLLTTIRAEESSQTKRRPSFDGLYRYIMRCDTGIHIRLTQLAITDKNYLLAHEYVQRGLHLHKQWMKLYEGEDNMGDGLIFKMGNILDDLSIEARMRLHRREICSPVSDSLTNSTSSTGILSSVSTE